MPKLLKLQCENGDVCTIQGVYAKTIKKCALEGCEKTKPMTERGKWCSNRCKQKNKNDKKRTAKMKSVFNGECNVSDEIHEEKMIRDTKVSLLDEAKAFDSLLGIDSLSQCPFQRVKPYKGDDKK